MSQLRRKIRKAMREARQVDVGSTHKDGKEIPDDKPINIHLDAEMPEDMDDKIRRILREETSKRAHQLDLDTFDESQDYDILDDFEQQVEESGYEFTEMQEERLKVFVSMHKKDDEDPGAPKGPGADNEEEGSVAESQDGDGATGSGSPDLDSD